MSEKRLSGAGGTSLGALTSIGSDLSVSVSFQVASELLDAARETDMREDELVGMVLGVAIALSALKQLLEYAKTERRKAAFEAIAADCKQTAPPDATPEMHACLESVKRRREQRLQSEKSLLDFALLFTSIATRIAFAVTVQLLAASARARQASRGARILSLMGLAAFFVFVESSAERRLF
jgi:hypothetical protein